MIYSVLISLLPFWLLLSAIGYTVEFYIPLLEGNDYDSAKWTRFVAFSLVLVISFLYYGSKPM